ncbi:MAG: YbaK/EbsC family protein [Nitrososphaerota archaeon]
MLGIDSVKKFMKEKGANGTIIELGEGKARSSVLAALAVGCSVTQIAKNIVVETECGDVFLVIISGDKRVDLSKVSKLVGANLKLASPENVLEETGYVVGGVPPFGHKKRMKTFLDRSVERFSEVYTSGGSPDTLLKISVNELRRLTAAEIVDVSK